MTHYFHSVTLDTDKCMGCINCIKRCPTEAIRVHDGKASIIPERCIDCGECIRVCPHHAKKTISDDWDILKKYEYVIALPAPALYAQFNNLNNAEPVLQSLLKIGFDAVYEVATAAEMISDATRQLMANARMNLPVISSACPAVTRLIRVRFPTLVKHVLPLVAPVELAAMEAKKIAMKKTGLPSHKIGAIFISPCPAKVTHARNPIGLEQSSVDAVLTIKSLYPRLLKVMESTEVLTLSQAGGIGLAWAQSGGEAEGLIFTDSYLAADGVENVIKVLEALEDEQLGSVDFVELNMCSGGCVGGVLTVENPYIAQAKLKKIYRTLPVNKDYLHNSIPTEMLWNCPLEYQSVLELGKTKQESFDMYAKLENIIESLPGLDCGSCGAPNCVTFAEDVVRGIAKVDDCVVRMREKMEAMLKKLQEKETKE